jgi:hypothetical protein
MGTETVATAIEAAIWERVIHPEGDLSPATARAILRLAFSDADRQRMHELARKAQEGALSPAEEADIEGFDRVGTLLSILKSKARKVLKRTSRRQH